jgi:hypothetical protein
MEQRMLKTEKNTRNNNENEGEERGRKEIRVCTCQKKNWKRAVKESRSKGKRQP